MTWIKRILKTLIFAIQKVIPFSNNWMMMIVVKIGFNSPWELLLRHPLSTTTTTATATTTLWKKHHFAVEKKGLILALKNAILLYRV
jgi:hypothetical protein